MARALFLLAAILAVAGCASAKSTSKIYNCTVDFTYNSSYYPVLPNGNFKEIGKGNWINIAFNNAVKAATAKLKELDVIPVECKVLSTRKHYGCYDSVKPGVKGAKQVAGMYAFYYRVRYACPKGVVPLTILQNIYTRRNGSFWSPTRGFYWSD